MNAEVPSIVLPTVEPKRLLIVTGFAWVVIIIAGLASVISFFSLLMIIAGNEGTKNADAIGFFNVVIRPPLTLVAGCGLLFRKRWAYFYTLSLLLLIFGYNVYGMAQGPAVPYRYVDANGVPTTVMTSGDRYSLLTMTFCAGLMGALNIPRVRREFTRPRVRSLQEIHAASAPQISHAPIDFVQPSVPPPLESHLKSPAMGRMDRGVALWKRWAFFAVVLIVLLCVTAVMVWLVMTGISTGETFFFSKSSSGSRWVKMADEPVRYWGSLIVYAGIGVASFLITAWGVRECSRAWKTY